ncbi:hypothetical protein, partial [Nocardia seriolae]|uniref:hypothetical protein n=2 Tax=Nocardia seriolae TaxID=37332 RepID=UPI001EE72A26
TNQRLTTLDRIDSSKGYAIDNVQWVHKDVNMIKWELSEEVFLATCLEIVNHTEFGMSEWSRVACSVGSTRLRWTGCA